MKKTVCMIVAVLLVLAFTVPAMADTVPEITVPAGMEVYQGDIVELYCAAKSPDGGSLTYLWYETTTGNLQDIIAVNRGAETQDTFRCDTGTCGTRYYVCAVSTADGTATYSSIIPVTVIEPEPSAEPPVITTNSLTDGVVGESYYVKLDCTDADAVFTISEFDGSFEVSGLYITQHGEIEGVPTEANSYKITVCASGAGGDGYMTYVLTVETPDGEAPAVEDPGDTEGDGEPGNAPGSQPGSNDQTGSGTEDAETTGPETGETETDGEEPAEGENIVIMAPDSQPDSAEKDGGMSGTVVLLIAAAAIIICAGAFFIMKKKQ